MLVIGDFDPESKKRSGLGTAVGTCGELVQGFTTEGLPFHVTCPIAKTSTVTVTLQRAPELRVEQLPMGNSSKITLALQETAAYLELEPCSIRVARWSDLEVGKGMGSSTADIVAAARALGDAIKRPLNPTELASIATAIESSDGSMYPGLVAFNQKTGATLARYKWWPQFVIAMITPISSLNTESANFSGKRELGAEFDELLAQLTEASTNHEVKPFADAATRSAALNQRFVPNSYFATLENKIESFGAVGINVGHTGTMTGLLFDATSPEAHLAAAAATVELQHLFPDARVEVTLTPSWPQSADEAH